MAEHKQPWWNDKDKVGGMAATVVVLAAAFLVAAVCVRIGVWIWP